MTDVKRRLCPAAPQVGGVFSTGRGRADRSRAEEKSTPGPHLGLADGRRRHGDGLPGDDPRHPPRRLLPRRRHHRRRPQGCAPLHPLPILLALPTRKKNLHFSFFTSCLLRFYCKRSPSPHEFPSSFVRRGWKNQELKAPYPHIERAGRVSAEHAACFPRTGPIAVTSLQVWCRNDNADVQRLNLWQPISFRLPCSRHLGESRCGKFRFLWFHPLATASFCRLSSMAPGFSSPIPWLCELLSSGSRGPGASWLRLMSFALIRLLARMQSVELVMLNQVPAVLSSPRTPRSTCCLLQGLREVAVLPLLMASVTPHR